MRELDAILKNAVENGDVPFMVAAVGDKNGTVWSGAAGDRVPGAAANAETVFRIYSMTKAIGAAAAMILVERGQLNLDAEVESILPEFSKIEFLEGFDRDTPILRPPRTKATVRQLATHTSGLVYEFWNADIKKYLEVTGLASVLSGQKTSLMYPMVFEAGERWDYGIGIDWLGQIVEAIDGRRIDQFCKQEIFDPLEMPDTRFEIEGTMQDRLAKVVIRGEDGEFADFELAPPSNPEFYGMGSALYSTVPDYMRFLRCLLNNGELDGQRILSAASVDTFLANHIGNLRVGKLTTVIPALTADVEVFPELTKSVSLGFLRVESDVPDMRSAGSQGWAGVANTHFWFDPKKGLAAVLMTQTLPFVEPRFVKVYKQFELGVYANI